jgi:tetratricopeptide (TPR) repeat protein
MSASFAQNEKYVKAMESKVGLLDSNNKADTWKDLANSFERIGDAERTQWLPYYYASFCHVMAGYTSLPMDGSMGDNSSITDPPADKAEQLIDKAAGLAGENSEIYCVKKMIYSLRMMGNPMARYMTEGAKASEALEKAKALNENNPRVYILEGQDKFYTPEQFGGSKTEAKKLFEKANEIFMVIKPGSSIEPQWGRAQVGYFLSQLN